LQATVTEPTVILKDHPHAYLFRDADVEAMSLTSRESEHVLRGKVVGIDDAAMGWSRYAQTMAINMVSSSLLHLAATDESFHLASFMAGVSPPQSSEVGGSPAMQPMALSHPEPPPRHHSSSSAACGTHTSPLNLVHQINRYYQRKPRRQQLRAVSVSAASWQVTLNRQLFLPAANGDTRAGVSVRVMLQQCFRYSTPNGGSGEHVALDMASEAHPERAMQVRNEKTALAASRQVSSLCPVRVKWNLST
jgi:hypothetical protein